MAIYRCSRGTITYYAGGFIMTVATKRIFDRLSPGRLSLIRFMTDLFYFSKVVNSNFNDRWKDHIFLFCPHSVSRLYLRRKRTVVYMDDTILDISLERFYKSGRGGMRKIYTHLKKKKKKRHVI